MRRIIVPLVVLILTACGGGGSGSATSPPPPPLPPPPPTNESPAGIWEGTFTSTVFNAVDQVLGVATATGDIRFISIDSGSQFFGQVTVSGDAVSGTLRAVSLAGGQFAGGPASGSVNIEGTLSARNSISGTFIGVGDEGTFSLTFNNLYDRDSSILKVQDHWSAPETIFKILLPGLGAAPIGLAIQDTGDFAGADTDGCDYSGSIGILDPDFNIYDAALTVSSCGQLDGQYAGYGVLGDTLQADDTITLAVSTNEVSITGLMTRAVPQSASGVWTGNTQSPYSGLNQTIGIISEDNEARFFGPAGNQIAGNVEVFANVLRMDAIAFAQFGTVHADGSVQGRIDVRGTVVSRLQSSGTFDGVGDFGDYDITYDSIYARPSSLSLVEGQWSTPSPTGGTGSLDLFVGAAGDFSGSDDGCSYSGNISLIDTNFNAYRIEIQVSTCGGITGEYSGLGYLSDDTTSNDTFSISVANDVISLWAIFDR